MKHLSLLLLILSFLFISCKKENMAPNPKPAYNYFPSEAGLYRIYQVDSIYWDGFTMLHDTLHYKLKEKITGTYTDNQGRPTQRIERSKWIDSTQTWVIISVWCENLTSTIYERTEENIRYFKSPLVFKQGDEWNGNTYNTFGQQLYTMAAADVSDQSNGLQFSHTCKVVQVSDSNLVSDRYAEERYAADNGLYYKMNLYLEKDFITQEIKNGYLYTEQLISIAHEP